MLIGHTKCHTEEPPSPKNISTQNKSTATKLHTKYLRDVCMLCDFVSFRLSKFVNCDMEKTYKVK